MKQKFLLIASLAVGLLAAILANAWLRAKTGEVERQKAEFLAKTEFTVVLGASGALPQGTVLQRKDLAQMRIFARGTTSDHISMDDAMMVLGRTLRHSVDAGQPILWSYLDGGKNISRGLAEDISSGMRAVSIPVSGAAAVAGHVRPNDHVDVLGMFALPGQNAASDREPELVTMTVLQNVTVLATGAETARSAKSRASAGYSTVTLLVSPREAEVLVFAQQMKGRLFLTLRNPSDVHYEEETPRIDFAQISSEAKALNEERQNKIRRSSSPMRRSSPAANR